MLRVTRLLSRLWKMGLIIGIGVSVILASGVGLQAQDGSVFFPIGQGYTDVIPRQLVRTDDDRVYIVAGMGQFRTQLLVYWTNTPGLPQAGSFGETQVIELNTEPISVDAVYDGVDIMHLLVNTREPALYDYPFNVRTNTVQPPIPIVAHSATVEGYYIGTSGLSGMIDLEGVLHIAYWTEDNHIVHQPFAYDAGQNTLNEAAPQTQVDSNGSANHPVLAVSPVTNAVTIGWISEYDRPPQIRARTRSADGVWGAEEIASSGPVWTSRTAGVNIDQGPSLIIDGDDTRHLAYIEDYVDGGHYGRVHYAQKTQTDSVWTDTVLATHSHNPALALNDIGELYIIGHGPEDTGQNVNLYVSQRQVDGTWGEIKLFATPPVVDSFDSSPSVKWSVVGWNRPETIEFVFFSANRGDYNNTTVYYGRFGG